MDASVRYRNVGIVVYTLCMYILSVSSYIDSTKSRIKPLLETKGEMSDDDMEKFGRKDPDAYPPYICSLFAY